VNRPSGIGYADEGYENGAKRCISFAGLLFEGTTPARPASTFKQPFDGILCGLVPGARMCHCHEPY
jgi:hypothetical protein